MNDLRKAAEMALGVLLDPKTRADEVAEAVKVIRQALNLQTAIEKGTKAWADVSSTSEWVEQLRGNVDNVHMSEERVPKTDKSINEPVGWVKIDEVRHYLNSVGCGTIYKTAGEDRVPLYSAPYTKNDTKAGVLHKKWRGLQDKDLHFLWVSTSVKKINKDRYTLIARQIETYLKERNTHE